MNRRAKIVCTLGPATSTAQALAELIDAGMDVARLNFSHSTHAEHSAVYNMVREISAERGRPVGVLAEVRGDEIGVGLGAAEDQRATRARGVAEIFAEGLRGTIRIGMTDLQAWLSGNGAAGINNLMEDAATAEISRSQVWQWMFNDATLDTGALTLRASDRDDATNAPQTRVALSLIGTDETQLRKVYADLSVGGVQDFPLEPAFWGDIFGALTDKFGINWQVNIGSAVPG